MPPTPADAADAVESRLRDLGEFIREQRRRDRLSLRKLSELAGHLEPVPEPDRAGPAQAERRDPPGDRQGPAHLGRDPVRPGRDPRRARRGRATSSSRDPGATRRSPSARSRRWSTSTGRSSRTREPTVGADVERGRHRLTRPRRPRGPAGRICPVCRCAASPSSACTRLRSRSRARATAAGMNVYVRALASRAGARRRRAATCSPVATTPGSPTIVEVEPGFRVVHLAAGPPEAVPKHELIDLVDAARDRDARPPRSRRRRLRRAARELLDLGRGRAPAEARARRPARRDVPHARPGEGRCRRRRRPGAPGTRRAGDDQLHRPDARVDRRRARAARSTSTAPSATGSRSSRPGSTTRSSPRWTPASRQSTRAALDLGDGPTLLFVGRIQPLKGADLAVRTLAGARRSAGDAARGRRAERARGPGRAGAAPPPRARARPHRPGALRPAAAPRAPGHLLPGRRRLPGPEPHRVVRARRARGRRVRHAGRRGRASVGCGRSSTTASPGSWSTAATRSTSRARSRSCSPTRRSRRDGRERRGPLAAVRVEHHRGPVAPAVRGPRSRASRSSCL